MYGHDYPPAPEYSQVFPASHGIAGYPYATHARPATPSVPLQPYSIEQSRSGYDTTSPTGAPYGVSSTKSAPLAEHS